MGLFSKIKEGLEKTRKGMSAVFGGIFSSLRGVDEEMLEELTDALIMADVGAALSEEIIDEIRQSVLETVGDCQRMHVTDPVTIKGSIADNVKELLYHKTKRNPMVLPVILTV